MLHLPAVAVARIAEGLAVLVPAGSLRHRILLVVLGMLQPALSWALTGITCYAIYKLRYDMEMQRFETAQRIVGGEQALLWQAGTPLEWL